MRVELSVKGMTWEEALKEYVERRMHFVLSRFGSELLRVTIRLTKTALPQEPGQKRCQVAIQLLSAGSVSVVATHADLFVAIDRAAGRAGQSVQRQLLRTRCFVR
jgi:putative sigma-54 modulation protein